VSAADLLAIKECNMHSLCALAGIKQHRSHPLLYNLLFVPPF